MAARGEPKMEDATLETAPARATLRGRFDTQSVDTRDGGEARAHLAFTITLVGLRTRVRERSSAAATP